MYDCDNNRSPGASAGGDRKITLPKDSVLLNGSASSEADGKVTKWLWTKIAAPASLVIANTTDTATMVKNLIAGVYSFELKVTDDKGGAATDTVHIVVDSPSVNRLPIACAGTGYFIQQITSSLPGTKHSPACAHLYCSFTTVVLADTLFSELLNILFMENKNHFNQLITTQKRIAMFQKIKSSGFLLALAIVVTCCQSKLVSQSSVSTKGLNNQTQATKGLKDYFSKYFPVGVAVNTRSLRGDDSALIVKEFNSITPENDMKIGPVHPEENRYNFANADAIVAFAQRNNLKVRGHNLVWHFESQTPKWIFKDKDGNQASKELVLQRLKDHITTVVSRYKGKLYAWDVANEVISDKPDEYLRPSEWYKICGEDYIIKAFQWAHEVDPNAQLFYNDYNEISPVKREKIYRLVKSLKDAGVPIHGVGLQGHWAVNEPSRGQLDSTLKRFADLGLKIQITELDISVYPKEHDARERRPVDAFTDFTAEREQAQLEKYKMCFELFKKYRKAITSVTFWNLADRYSWLDNFPVRGRKDYPLLFDQNLKPKKAYWEVVKVVQ